MKNLLSLKYLSKEEIMDILHDAIKFRDGMEFKLSDKIVGNLFFEDSTRTQYSFMVAEKKLDMKVIAFNALGSSISKGETFYDTVKTIESFGVDALVIRHSENKYYEQLKNFNCSIINAGDGTGDHPTQNLLDLLTIYDEFGKFEGLKIMIVGDIKHSRVAHGNVEIMERLGMTCYISGPKEYMDNTGKFIEFDKGLEEVDVVMMLRIQNERHGKLVDLTNEEYLQLHGLTQERVDRMKPTSIVMHPAPFNRGIEIEDSVVECDKSRIFKQMSNGVFIRQSVIKRSLT